MDTTANLPPRKCGDCGFLAIRHRETGELIGAEKGWRSPPIPQRMFPVVNSTGRASPGMFMHEHAVFPICYEQAYPLGDEFNKALEGRNSNIPDELEIAYFRVIRVDRTCEDFVTWQQGATPQQHREMRDRERARERDDKRDAEMRAREDRRDADARWDRRWGLFIAVAGTILAGVLGALLSR